MYGSMSPGGYPQQQRQQGPPAQQQIVFQQHAAPQQQQYAVQQPMMMLAPQQQQQQQYYAPQTQMMQQQSPQQFRGVPQGYAAAPQQQPQMMQQQYPPMQPGGFQPRGPPQGQYPPQQGYAPQQQQQYMPQQQQYAQQYAPQQGYAPQQYAPQQPQGYMPQQPRGAQGGYGRGDGGGAYATGGFNQGPAYGRGMMQPYHGNFAGRGRGQGHGAFSGPAGGAGGAAAARDHNLSMHLIITVPSMVEVDLIVSCGYIPAPERPELQNAVERYVKMGGSITCFLRSEADNCILGRVLVTSSIRAVTAIPDHLRSSVERLPPTWAHIARVGQCVQLTNELVQWMPMLDFPDWTGLDSEAFTSWGKVIARHHAHIMNNIVAAVKSVDSASVIGGENVVDAADKASSSSPSPYLALLHPSLWASPTVPSSLALAFSVGEGGSLVACCKNSVGILIVLRAVKQYGTAAIDIIVAGLRQVPTAFLEIAIHSPGNLILSTICQYALSVGRRDYMMLDLWEMHGSACAVDMIAANLITCIIQFSNDTNELRDSIITSLVAAETDRVAGDSHGSRIYQAVLHRAVECSCESGLQATTPHAQLIQRLVQHFGVLATNNHANYITSSLVVVTAQVAGYFVDNSSSVAPNATKRPTITIPPVSEAAKLQAQSLLMQIVRSVSPAIQFLSSNKFASNVLEKLVSCSSTVADQLAGAVLTDPNFPHRLALDPFGNYVLKKILENVSQPNAALFVRALQPFEGEMQRSPYAKGVLFWLSKHKLMPM